MMMTSALYLRAEVLVDLVEGSKRLDGAGGGLNQGGGGVGGLTWNFYVSPRCHSNDQDQDLTFFFLLLSFVIPVELDLAKSWVFFVSHIDETADGV